MQVKQEDGTAYYYDDPELGGTGNTAWAKEELEVLDENEEEDESSEEESSDESDDAALGGRRRTFLSDNLDIRDKALQDAMSTDIAAPKIPGMSAGEDYEEFLKARANVLKY